MNINHAETIFETYLRYRVASMKPAMFFGVNMQEYMAQILDSCSAEVFWGGTVAEGIEKTVARLEDMAGAAMPADVQQALTVMVNNRY